MKNAFMLMHVCAVLFIAACTSEKTNTNTQEKFPVVNPIVTDTVYKQEYVADIHAIQNVEIRSRVKGFIDEILVDEGMSVHKGQTLFLISNSQYKEELAKAKAAYKSALAEAKTAEFELKSAIVLLEGKVISRSQVDLAQAKVDALKAKAEEAHSGESAAALNLSFTVIKAPFEGIINRIPKKAGSLIDEGELLTTISNNKEVFAYFNVSEKEYLGFIKSNNLKSQQDVTLFLADGLKFSEKGTVETVESEIDKNTGSIAFRARFKNGNLLLKHGSSGRIQLSQKLENALLIPQKATFEIQENTYVFVVDKNNVVHMQSIIPKLRLPHLYVVESGLKPTDKIIYEGIQSLKDGDKIIPELVKAK